MVSHKALEVSYQDDYQQCLDILGAYRDYVQKIKGKCRRPNVPEYVSETLVRLVMKTIQNIDSIHAKDLLTSDGLQIQVKIAPATQSARRVFKCFSSQGPTSFGPRTKMDRLYIMDATRYEEEFFSVYAYENTNEIMKLPVNCHETIGDQCQQGRRPRIAPDNMIHDRSPIFKGSTQTYLNELKPSD